MLSVSMVGRNCTQSIDWRRDNHSLTIPHRGCLFKFPENTLATVFSDSYDHQAFVTAKALVTDLRVLPEYLPNNTHPDPHKTLRRVQVIGDEAIRHMEKKSSHLFPPCTEGNYIKQQRGN